MEFHGNAKAGFVPLFTIRQTRREGKFCVPMRMRLKAAIKGCSDI